MEVLTKERGAQTRQRLGWEYVWGGHWSWWWGGCRYQEEERAVFGVDEGDLVGLRTAWQLVYQLGLSIHSS